MRVERGDLCGPTAIFFVLSFLIVSFEPIGNFLFIQGNILRNFNLMFRLKCFPKTIFCPTTTYSGLCSSGHPCIKNLFLVVFLGRGVIYLENTFELRQSPPKIMYTRIDFRGTNGHTKNRQRKKHSASFQIYSIKRDVSRQDGFWINQTHVWIINPSCVSNFWLLAGFHYVHSSGIFLFKDGKSIQIIHALLMVLNTIFGEQRWGVQNRKRSSASWGNLRKARFVCFTNRSSKTE